MWGRASALQKSADPRPGGSSGAYSGCPDWAPDGAACQRPLSRRRPTASRQSIIPPPSRRATHIRSATWRCTAAPPQPGPPLALCQDARSGTVTLAARRQVRDGQAGGSQLPVSSDAAAARREHPTRESAHCTAASVPPPPGTPEIVRSRTGTAFDSRHTTPRDRAIRGHVRRMRALRRHAAPG